MRAGALTVIVAWAGLSLCACQPKAAKPVDTCKPPVPIVTPNATPKDLAKDTAYNCLRQAAYEGVRGGATIDAAAAAALTSCKPQADAYVKAQTGNLPNWDYEHGAIRDELASLAHATAVQKRSRGCGRPGGQADSLPGG